MRLKDGKICGCKECSQDHCDELCRQEWYMEKRRRKNAQIRADKLLFRPLKQCDYCGRLYLPIKSDQRYCRPECSHAVLRTKQLKTYNATWWSNG